MKTLTIGILFVLSSLTSFSQNAFKTFQINHDLSGNGLGKNISIGVGIGKGNSLLSFNINFQKKRLHLSGINLNYKHTVLKSENEKMELFFSANATIHTRAYLSDKSARIEQLCNPEKDQKYKSLSLTVYESYIGFGLKFNHTDKISTSYNVGFGGYTTLNKNYDYKMYRQKSAQSAQLQFTIMYRI